MVLPGHIVDLVCSLEEQAVDDNEIIRWCISMLNNPRSASLATAFLERCDRTMSDINDMFSSLSQR